MKIDGIKRKKKYKSQISDVNVDYEKRKKIDSKKLKKKGKASQKNLDKTSSPKKPNSKSGTINTKDKATLHADTKNNDRETDFNVESLKMTLHDVSRKTSDQHDKKIDKHYKNIESTEEKSSNIELKQEDMQNKRVNLENKSREKEKKRLSSKIDKVKKGGNSEKKDETQKTPADSPGRTTPGTENTNDDGKKPEQNKLLSGQINPYLLGGQLMSNKNKPETTLPPPVQSEDNGKASFEPPHSLEKSPSEGTSLQKEKSFQEKSSGTPRDFRKTISDNESPLGDLGETMKENDKHYLEEKSHQDNTGRFLKHTLDAHKEEKTDSQDIWTHHIEDLNEGQQGIKNSVDTKKAKQNLGEKTSLVKDALQGHSIYKPKENLERGASSEEKPERSLGSKPVNLDHEIEKEESSLDNDTTENEKSVDSNKTEVDNNKEDSSPGKSDGIEGNPEVDGLDGNKNDLETSMDEPKSQAPGDDLSSTVKEDTSSENSGSVESDQKIPPENMVEKGIDKKEVKEDDREVKANKKETSKKTEKIKDSEKKLHNDKSDEPEEDNDDKTPEDVEREILERNSFYNIKQVKDIESNLDKDKELQSRTENLAYHAKLKKAGTRVLQPDALLSTGSEEKLYQSKVSKKSENTNSRPGAKMKDFLNDPRDSQMKDTKESSVIKGTDGKEIKKKRSGEVLDERDPSREQKKTIETSESSSLNGTINIKKAIEKSGLKPGELHEGNLEQISEIAGKDTGTLLESDKVYKNPEQNNPVTDRVKGKVKTNLNNYLQEGDRRILDDKINI